MESEIKTKTKRQKRQTLTKKDNKIALHNGLGKDPS